MNANIDKLFDEDLEKMPSLPEFIKNLDYLRNVDLSNSTITEIENIFYEYATIFPQIPFTQKPDRFNNHTFYRVRLNINSENEDLRLIQTYSYPNPFFCKENGRANLKGKSVFYCSNRPGAALLESKPKIGDEGFLSIWKPNATREIKIAMCLPQNLRKENEWSYLASVAHNFSINFYSENAKEKSMHFIELINFIAERFVNEAKPYSITSWMSNELLYGEKWKDIILYPSIATHKRYCNLAIHPNTVETQLRFVKVIRFKVKDINEGIISYAPVSVGEIINSNIEWRRSEPEERDFIKFI